MRPRDEPDTRRMPLETKTFRSTALLYINEMEHMPQSHLLGAQFLS